MPCAIPQDVIDQTIAYHGHSCLGLAIGIRASELAFRELGKPDEVEMVAVSETDMCGVDAIQFLTGCTLGKGDFIHRDYGKMAFTFFDRKTGNGVRAVLCSLEEAGDYNLMRKLMGKESTGTATSADLDQLEGLREDMRVYCMSSGLDKIFSVAPVELGPPRPAAILESIKCAGCGESVMESRTRRYGGATYCIPCFADVDQKI